MSALCISILLYNRLLLRETQQENEIRGIQTEKEEVKLFAYSQWKNPGNVCMFIDTHTHTLIYIYFYVLKPMNSALAGVAQCTERGPVT